MPHTFKSIALCLIGSLGCATAATSAPEAAKLSLTVTGRAASVPDAMIAHLTVQSIRPGSPAAQAAVNRTMTAALAAAHAIHGLRATTGAYDVAPADAKRSAWRASQGLTLRFDASPDAPAAQAVRDLIGHLQTQGILLDNLAGTLSTKAARAARAVAITDAVGTLHAEIRTIADALHDEVGPINTLQLGTNTPFRPLVRMPMLASMVAPMGATTAPQARAAPIVIRVSLSATVRLQPRAN